MSLLSRLESRYRRWAIPNLTVLIIAGQAALMLIILLRGQDGASQVMGKIALVPALILEGEVWRLATFPFMPPASRVIFFALISWMLFYLFGNSLEQTWGAFRYNVYLLIAYIANLTAAFALHFLWGAESGMGAHVQPLGMTGSGANVLLYGGVFLAFVRLFPNMIINLLFVLPIRIYWLGLLAWIGIGYQLLTGTGVERVFLLAMITNYLVFFGREHLQTFRDGKRRRSFEAKLSKGKGADKPRHRCLVCGLDSQQSPKTLFRYCSKCAGQSCYCPDHIRDHQHILEGEATQP